MNKKNDSILIIFIVICIVGPFVVMSGMLIREILHLDVKAIPAKYNSEQQILQYDGRTYHLIEMNDSSYSHQRDLEVLGRVKGSGLLLYCYKNDPDKSIIKGNALDIGYVFSDRYTEIPTDGEVTSVYVDLAQRREIESRIHYTLVKDEYLRDVEEVDLFKLLWEERYKNEPLIFKNGQVVDELDYIWVRFCFEECPEPGVGNHLIFHNEKWYLVDTEYEYVDGQHIQTDYCYLIDNDELIEYLTNFMKYEGNLEEQ